ncbi:DUF1822 family protein [Brasilonema sp. UFV-L1]|uniref:DUF1822 family protein n=1 Tax=Brasilonema sp. UFV-L1 TaxID=2234130 RepID=UPI00145EF9DF|nr:DUF1822 family protein [Brasilonema sp. UFV-L1]
MNNTPTSFSIGVPLTSIAHEYARQFEVEQATSQKGKQVYLNTLAVYAVHSFLQLMDIATDISQSNSWHPIIRRFHNVADLILPEFGCLECRPVLTGEKVISLPKEATEDRIGIVAVLFEEHLEQVHMLGFAPADAAGWLPQEIQISQLQPLDLLLDQLEKVAAQKSSIAKTSSQVSDNTQFLQIQATDITQNLTIVNLSQWLQNFVDAGWQTVQEIFGTQRAYLIFATRSAEFSQSIVRAQQISLGMLPTDEQLALVVAVVPKVAQKRQIILQVHPTKSHTLPPGLQSIVLDTNGNILLRVEAKNADNKIQLKIDGKPGEQFRLKIALREASFTKDFVI